MKMVSEAVGKEYSEPEAGDLLWSAQDGTTAPIKKKTFSSVLETQYFVPSTQECV